MITQFQKEPCDAFSSGLQFIIMKSSLVQVLAIFLLGIVSARRTDSDIFSGDAFGGQRRGGIHKINYNGNYNSQLNSPHLPNPQSRERKPNIVLILTDDQDVELGKSSVSYRSSSQNQVDRM